MRESYLEREYLAVIAAARDGEMIAVEVVAVDSKAALETVVWLGCVQYDGLRRVWETRASQTVSQRLSQTNLLSIFGQSKVATSTNTAQFYDVTEIYIIYISIR